MSEAAAHLDEVYEWVFDDILVWAPVTLGESVVMP